ncbi:hypothetical protein OUZ56_026786 [Daphnia magna]|uniref:Uncharacterized protein n=1 Tax=Daphnia magna TaxID=35525 RepID=A0ABQ9ZMS4_9CRUS|nr:hypothetical protein OUZ56_026786 [Daphnia magna]
MGPYNTDSGNHYIYNHGLVILYENRIPLANEDPELNNSNKRRLLPHIQQAATFTPNMNAAKDRILLLPIRRLLPSAPHEAALSPRTRPVVCRRINFSEDKLKNVDCLDNSGMDNQDQPI